MKKKALVLLAVGALVFSAVPVYAQTGTCADWEGTWTFTYTGNITDTVTITDICSKPTVSTLTPECMPEGPMLDAWMCVAKGTRLSNSQEIQIRQIAHDTTVFNYYEGTDPEILEGGATEPNDKISAAGFSKCAFTADEVNYGLASGQKDNCTETTTTTTTPSGPCPAQKVLGDDSPDLDSLRALRDGPLAKSAVGRGITRIYYSHADAINAALDRSPVLQALARKMFRAIVLLEGK